MKYFVLTLVLITIALGADAQISFQSEICVPLRPAILNLKGKKDYMDVSASAYRRGFGYTIGFSYSRKKAKYHISYTELWIVTREYYITQGVNHYYWDALNKRPRLFLGLEKPIKIKGISLNCIGGIHFALPTGTLQPPLEYSSKLYRNGEFLRQGQYDVEMNHSVQFKVFYTKGKSTNRLKVIAGLGLDYVLPYISHFTQNYTRETWLRASNYTKEFNTIYFSPTLGFTYFLGRKTKL